MAGVTSFQRSGSLVWI